MLERNIDYCCSGLYTLSVRDSADPGYRRTSVRVIDPAPAVARQTLRLLEKEGLQAPQGKADNRSYYTTGDPKALGGSCHCYWARTQKLQVSAGNLMQFLKGG